jgi:hypothetical protein
LDLRSITKLVAAWRPPARNHPGSFRPSCEDQYQHQLSLRDHLRAIDKLKPAQELSFKTQISDLANDRDNSVHKARDIQQDQLKIHLETAKKFISKYSHMTMGRDILLE